LTRSAAKAEAIRSAGAQAAIADGLDAAALTSAARAAEPDIMIDEMTDLGAVTDLRHFDRAFATTNRLRTEGIDILLAAARTAGQNFSSRKVSAAGLSAARAAPSNRNPISSTRIRRANSAGHCRRFNIWRAG
jgi:hypothetical protein